MNINQNQSPLFSGGYVKQYSRHTNEERARALARPSSENLIVDEFEPVLGNHHILTGKQAKDMDSFKEEMNQAEDARKGAESRNKPLVPTISKVWDRAVEGRKQLLEQSVPLPES